MYGFEGVGLSEVQLSISEVSVMEVGGWVVTRQTHFMVGPGRGPTIIRRPVNCERVNNSDVSFDR